MEAHKICNMPTFERIKNQYETRQSWGLVTSVDVKNCDAGFIRSPEAIKEYVKQLCNLIDMKRFGETQVVHFGEDEKVAGYSMVQLIETSLISGHFANQTNTAYIDVFSCKIYDPYQVKEFTLQYFKGSEANINIFHRE